MCNKIPPCQKVLLFLVLGFGILFLLIFVPTYLSVTSSAQVGGRSQKILVFGGDLRNGTRDSALELDLEEHKWTELGRMPTPRMFHSIAAVKGKVYLIGGMVNRSNILSTVDVYDVNTENWTKVTSMDYGRGQASAVAVNENIIICGGLRADVRQVRIKSCLNYSIPEDSWSEMPSLVNSKSSLVMVHIEGFLYAIGGAGIDLKSVERFDFRFGFWSAAPSLLEARYGHSATAMGKRIYVAGGGNKGSTSVEVFDPEQSAWTMVTPMNSQRTAFNLLNINGVLHAVGGVYYVSVERFDPETEKWDFLMDYELPEGRLGFQSIYA